MKQEFLLLWGSHAGCHFALCVVSDQWVYSFVKFPFNVHRRFDGSQILYTHYTVQLMILHDYALCMSDFRNEKNTYNRLTTIIHQDTMPAQTITDMSNTWSDLALMTKKYCNIYFSNCYNVHQSTLAYYWCPLLFKALTAFSLFSWHIVVATSYSPDLLMCLEWVIYSNMTC